MTGRDLFSRTPFARPMKELPLSCLDVGSRGGIEPDLLPIAFAVDAIGFEPDAAECERLNAGEAGPWRTTRFIPAALAGKSGSATLHAAEDPVSSSLLPPVMETAKRFGMRGYSNIVGAAEVETYSLDDAVAAFDLASVDFIKLDTEGTELDILRSGEQALSQAIGVKVEVSFMRIRDGQPPAREIDDFMSDRGFELMDLMTPSHWRVHGHVIHPQLSDQAIPYSRGQLAHGDFLYLRHPGRMEMKGLGETKDAERRLRAAWAAMAYGYFDRAEEYLDTPAVRKMIDRRWNVRLEPALRQASLRFGWMEWRTAFYRQVRDVVPYLRYGGAALFHR